MWETALVDALLSFGISDCHQPGNFVIPQCPGTSEGSGVSTTKPKQRSLKRSEILMAPQREDQG